MKPKKLSRRGFIKVAAVSGGALVVGGVVRQVHNQLGRNFQPARARAYLDSIQVGAAQGSLPNIICLLYTSPSPRDLSTSRMPSSA